MSCSCSESRLGTGARASQYGGRRTPGSCSGAPGRRRRPRSATRGRPASRAAPSCSSSAAASASTWWPARPGRARGRRRSARRRGRRASSRSCRTFLTQCARCHWALSQSAAVTSVQPGKRVQSGSTSRRGGRGRADRLPDRSRRMDVSMVMRSFSRRLHVARVVCVLRASATWAMILRRCQTHAAESPVELGLTGRMLRDGEANTVIRSDCTGSGAAGVLPQAAAGSTPTPRSGPTRCAIARRAAQPRRGVFRQLEAPARRRRCGRPAQRCSRSSSARGKMQNPVTGSGGMLIGTVEDVGRIPAGAGRRRPGRHPGLPHADAARHRGRAGPLGRPHRAGPGRRLRDPVRPQRSPPGSPTTSRPRSRSPSWTCAAPRR